MKQGFVMKRFARTTLFLVFATIATVLATATESTPASAGGGCRGIPSTAAAGDQVRMTNLTCFTPTVLYAEPGSTVTWTNDTELSHDVAGATIEWGNYTSIPSGGTVSHRFDRAGTYPYYCFEHPGMVGAVVVGDGRPADVAATNPVGAGRSAAASETLRVADPADPEPLDPSGQARSTATKRSDSSNVALVTMATLVGGVIVAVAFSARSVRRG